LISPRLNATEVKTLRLALANAAFKLDFIAPKGRFPTQVTIKCKTGSPKVFNKHLKLTQGVYTVLSQGYAQTSHSAATVRLKKNYQWLLLDPPACGVFTRVSTKVSLNFQHALF